MGGGESLFLDAGTLKIFKFILESSSFRSENECLLFMAAATTGYDSSSWPFSQFSQLSLELSNQKFQNRT